MSGSEDYSSWRLQTNGGVRYRFLGSTGSFNSEGGEIDWKCIIRSKDLYEVLLELFPGPVILGGVTYPNTGTMPGFPSMCAKKISYRNHLDGLPVDPYEYDTTDAPLGTYSEYLELTIQFAPGTAKSANADPLTFLEISGAADGEVIYVPPTDTTLTSEEGEGGTNDVPGEGDIDLNGLVNNNIRPGAEARPSRTPILPTVLLVPTTKWTLKWKQIPADHFRNVLIHRLRFLMGRVNRETVPWLYNAAPETLLFLGFNHTESYSWRLSNLESPPIDIEMQIIEKRVVWNGVVCGHNHVFEPGKGWVRQKLENGDPMYKKSIFSFLFNP